MKCQEIHCNQPATKKHQSTFVHDGRDESGKYFNNRVCTTQTHLCDSHADMVIQAGSAEEEMI